MSASHNPPGSASALTNPPFFPSGFLHVTLETCDSLKSLNPICSSASNCKDDLLCSIFDLTQYGTNCSYDFTSDTTSYTCWVGTSSSQLFFSFLLSFGFGNQSGKKGSPAPPPAPPFPPELTPDDDEKEKEEEEEEEEEEEKEGRVVKGDGAALALPRISRVILVFLLVVFVSSSHRRLFFFSLSLSESKSQVTPKDEGVAKEAAAVVVAVVVDSLLSPHLLNNMVDITQATQRAVHSLSLLLSLSLSLSLSLFSYPRRLLCCSVCFVDLDLDISIGKSLKMEMSMWESCGNISRRRRNQEKRRKKRREEEEEEEEKREKEEERRERERKRLRLCSEDDRHHSHSRHGVLKASEETRRRGAQVRKEKSMVGP